MPVLINIDVPDLGEGVRFYVSAFGLHVGRQLGAEVIELLGWEAPVYLLANAAGTIGAAIAPRDYRRHWTPIHLDVVVDDLGPALARAAAAGAQLESGIRTTAWGRIGTLSDPFGHGFCLIQFLNRGYDELTTPGLQASA